MTGSGRTKQERGRVQAMEEEQDHGDRFATGGGPLGTASDYDGYTSNAANPFDALSGVQPDLLGGARKQPAFKPEYLHYQPKAWYERLAYNTGFAYLFGIGSGGLYGVFNGFTTSPSNKLRIRLNSILNKSGRFGSRFGNALGAVAMMYSCLEEFTDRAHIEDYIPFDEDLVNPPLAAALTGILYKSTQGPKTMVLAGLLGGTAVAGFNVARSSMSQGGKRLMF